MCLESVSIGWLTQSVVATKIHRPGQFSEGILVASMPLGMFFAYMFVFCVHFSLGICFLLEVNVVFVAAISG